MTARQRLVVIAVTTALVTTVTTSGASGSPPASSKPYSGALLSQRPMALSEPLVAVGARGYRLSYLSPFSGEADEIVSPGVDHGGIVAAALPGVLSWMDARVAGTPAPSTC